MPLIKKALFLALLGSQATCVCAVNYSMDVYFTGTYTDETCVVEINNGSNNEVVTLPKISVMSLRTNGSEAGSVPFNITLKECPASRTVTVFFSSSVSGADTVTGNLINDTGPDMSKNVQIRLRKEDSSQVIIDDATSGQDYLISATADPLSHRFLASYYAKGDSAPTAGKVQTVSGVELVYK
ncbi:fimbrial protein [Citrobacter rodentium]|uniref:Fimbrial adhesin n=2 Tax=Citrobacter rodentium TaxID=67825 RepID=D2THT7_CITRI|nr:fimbrial protein [Citrobacter rodentium]KIQ49540.1 fimbrial protein [Citrobacter rodentium]QBY29243.1 type 1 fimbrial protein [Citrobacter rodentium]UHO33349.1 type 1 fimbrial protein [Citrobacter rodentium NBRC 105723 = DSM 16636]CBG89520.1 putative fimbrial adhesin [Citrobacter rodentium ICC168]HAT8012015.1 type 1 fimbrial protein [Citrobacter rodentium NBRC 105723 = DSM 16636]